MNGEITMESAIKVMGEAQRVTDTAFDGWWQEEGVSFAERFTENPRLCAKLAFLKGQTHGYEQSHRRTLEMIAGK